MLEREELHHAVVNLDLHVVDGVFFLDHVAGEACVAIQDGLHGLLDGALGMRWPLAGPVRWLQWTIDTVLLTAALMLMTITGYDPIEDGWLTVKVGLIAVYVVLGYFAIATINPEFVTRVFSGADKAFTLMAAGIAVGILTVPIVATVAEDALRAVPMALREASYGLGAQRLQLAAHTRGRHFVVFVLEGFRLPADLPVEHSRALAVELHVALLKCCLHQRRSLADDSLHCVGCE